MHVKGSSERQREKIFEFNDHYCEIFFSVTEIEIILLQLN